MIKKVRINFGGLGFWLVLLLALTLAVSAIGLSNEFSQTEKIKNHDDFRLRVVEHLEDIVYLLQLKEVSGMPLGYDCRLNKRINRGQFAGCEETNNKENK